MLAVAAVAAGIVLRSATAARRLSMVATTIAVSAAAAAIAASAVAMTAPARQPEALTVGSGTHVVDAVGTVAAAPVERSGGMQLRITISDVEWHDSAEITGSMPVLLFVPPRDDSPTKSESLAALQIGATVSVHGTLRANGPGESSAFMLFASRDPHVVAAPPVWLSWANDLRSGFANAARALPGDGGRLLPGLSIGDVSSVGVELDASMKQSSLSHLTAVSGANCAVIIAVMMMLGRLAAVSRRLRVAAALIALVGFVILVTPGPSVLRAAVMAAIIVFSTAAGRPGRGVPSLCAAVIVLLIADPWMAVNYGFALSVLATAGLLVLAPPLTQALSRRMPAAIAAAIAIPLAAQLACQPVLLMLSPAVPLYGVAANLLAEPAAGLATILGLIACVLLPWFPSLGFACAQLAWVPSAWIAAVAHVCSDLAGSQLPWPEGIAGIALMVALIVAVILVVVRAVRRSVRIAAIVALVIFTAAYTGVGLGSTVGRQLAMPVHWQLGACDIGQGDAVLIHSGGAHGLVDVGPDPAPLAQCMKTLGIERIDLLVLTHYDKDHVGGLNAVIGHVDTALVGQPTDQHDQALVDALVRGGADVRVAADGDRGTLGRLDWRVLWPTVGSRQMQTGNEGSVTVSFSGAGMTSIFLGDLDERAQNALLASGRVRPVDVVKVAHHGSADQSERLYDALHARIGLISVGADNDYGHPTARLLGILARAGTRVFRTDLNGMVLVCPGLNGALSTWSERAASNSALQVPGTGRRH
jgi:competence protein ComEC